jgi:hypothetical protein
MVIAMNRKPADAVKEKPKNVRHVSSPLPYSDAINRVLGFAQSQGYKVEEVLPDGSRAILSTPVNLFSYGFFFPVYFSVGPGGGTFVEVGIAGRAFQWGPIVTRNHDKFYTLVQQAVLPYAPPQPPSAYPQQIPPPPYPSQPPPYSPYPDQPPPNPQYPNQPPPGSGPYTPG